MRRTILLVIFNFSLFTFHSVFAQQYKVRSFSWERVEVTSQLDATPSEAAAAIVAPYKVRVDSIMAPVLGMSRVAMSKERPESLLGNWAADVMVEGGTATGLAPADMGLFNVGGLRNNMPEGIVRRGDILLISPFENYVVVLEMKGTDLLDLMHNIAAVGGEAVSSSVRMEITSDGNLLSCTISGKEIDPHRTYTVATIDYLAEMGYDPDFGARPVKRAIQQYMLNDLSKKLLSGDVNREKPIIVDSFGEGLVFRN